MSLEKLGLGNTTASTLSIPIGSTVAVEDAAGFTGYGDAGAAYGEQGAFPCAVGEGGFAFEDDDGVVRKVGHFDRSVNGHGG